MADAHDDGAVPFTPALLVVDFQEDFCPPHGALAVPQGRSIASIVNLLLTLPFALRLATRDWHPPDHISFSASHPGLRNGSTAAVVHPHDPSRRYDTLLWPTHCVAGSPGAALVPELRADCLDGVVDKGTDRRLEMYSAFYDPFRLVETGLAERLRAEAVTHVFVVGLAADFCVAATAEHARDEGFATYVVREATRPVYPDAWPASVQHVFDKGVRLVSVDGPEVARVRALSRPSCPAPTPRD
ncbi:hypothetical protein CDD83_10148 [Cordyceps sp. RAO-2017]|nr:hypothetical protein CDD83_10148 [Cordyceps sp. RAO-2017]